MSRARRVWRRATLARYIATLARYTKRIGSIRSFSSAASAPRTFFILALSTGLAVTGGLALPGLGAPAGQAADADISGDKTRSNWLAPVLPAVVSITTVKFVPDPENNGGVRRVDGFGSGFVVEPTGLIVTNRHVIEDATELRVTFRDGMMVPATPVFAGMQIDLALLKVDAGKPLPVLKLADSDKVQIGDPVAAVGNPLGLGGSVSSGIVSGLNRDIMSSAFDNFIQTDAAINHGNSGGPLVNMRGEVIGVDTAIYSPTATSGSIGIGFALPSNDVTFVVDQVLRYGQIRAGWIGLNAQTVTQEIAVAVGLASPRGSIVAGVQANSPAAAAGLKDGDVILKLAAREPADSRALARAIAERAPGDTVPVVVWREGKELTLSVKLGEWQNHPMRGMEHTPAVRTVRADMVDYGLSFGPITEEVRRKLHLERNQAGAVVTQVAIDSPSADSGFRAGDLVLRVQTDEVNGPNTARKALTDAVQQKRPVIIVLVQRPDGFRWLPLVGSYVRPG